MKKTRRELMNRLRLGAPAAAVTLVLALGMPACGGNGGSEGGAEGGAEGGGQAYCDYVNQENPASNSPGPYPFFDPDPGSGDFIVLTDPLERAEAVTPPAEIQDAWTTVLEVARNAPQPEGLQYPRVENEDVQTIQDELDALREYVENNCWS